MRDICHRWLEPYSRASYAQSGEDIVLEWYLSDREVGFYVDVGAYHPKRFSNTYRLYNRGWRGINIDANPKSMNAFRRIRPRDTNIEAAVGPSSHSLTYYIFRQPSLNTFDRDLALQHVAEGRPIHKELHVTTAPLVELLDKYLPANTEIDLLTVDVEGLDLEVLQSNNWARYSPRFVLAECLNTLTMDMVARDETTAFLRKHNYSSVAKTVHTVLYKRMAD